MAGLPAIGRYDLLELIGQGGMGSVYRAHDPWMDRFVAVKTIEIGGDPGAREEMRLRVMREIRASAKMSHPNIVAVYDVGEHESLAYLVMELVDGKPLKGPLPLTQALPILRQAAEALDYAHEQRVVHRDVKPANILVDGRGGVKVLDFGIARVLGEQSLTQTGGIVGTWCYMAPEQYQAQKVGPPADQFALAVVAYELVSGQRPFLGDKIPEISYSIVHVQPPAMPGVSYAVDGAVRRALAKDPAERYATCAEFVRAVERAMEVETATTVDSLPPPARPPERSRKSAGASGSARPRRRFAAVVAGLVVAAMFATLFGLSSRQGEVGEVTRASLNGVPIEFVWIPPGEFEMGCSPGDNECADHESPRHRVRITKGFELGKYEVTQAQWEAVVGSNPSGFEGADRPVERVSWEETQAFLKKLNERDDGYRYRLPTEAEWEYSARAGGTSARYGDLDEMGWYGGNSGDETKVVGGKEPNAWGLHDMLGNVFELCQDSYDGSYYGSSASADPSGPATGSDRVIRGGSWNQGPMSLRASHRSAVPPTTRWHVVGIRLLREAYAVRPVWRYWFPAPSENVIRGAKS